MAQKVRKTTLRKSKKSMSYLDQFRSIKRRVMAEANRKMKGKPKAYRKKVTKQVWHSKTKR